MSDLTERLRSNAPALHLLSGDDITDDYTHDESLTSTPSARTSWSYRLPPRR